MVEHYRPHAQRGRQFLQAELLHFPPTRPRVAQEDGVAGAVPPGGTAGSRPDEGPRPVPPRAVRTVTASSPMTTASRSAIWSPRLVTCTTAAICNPTPATAARRAESAAWHALGDEPQGAHDRQHEAGEANDKVARIAHQERYYSDGEDPGRRQGHKRLKSLAWINAAPSPAHRANRSPTIPRCKSTSGNKAAGRVVKAGARGCLIDADRSLPCCRQRPGFRLHWNSGSLITPLSRNSASRVVSSAAPERCRWWGSAHTGGRRRSVAEPF